MLPYKRMKYGNQKICIVCNKLKYIKGNFRVVNIHNGYTSSTCRSCEQSTAIYHQEGLCPVNGCLYLVFDSAFPEYIKIGYTTDTQKRLQKYNGNRPLDTCSYVYVSRILADILKVEESILKRINTYAHSTPNRREWFSVDYKAKFIEEIKLAEADINNHPSIN